MVRHASHAAAAAALLLFAPACDGSHPPARSPAKAAGAALTSGASCPGTSAHARHINLFACGTCHPSGGTLGFTSPFTFPGGTTSAGGTIVRGTATTPTTCSVGCHNPGGAPREVAWDAPGPLACTSCHDTSTFPATHPPIAANVPRADCERCHTTSGHLDGAVALAPHAASWRDETSAGFHAYEANRGLAECQVCHGEDLAGGAAGEGCGECHDQATPVFVSWKARCTMCHGGTDNQTGAPPVATWGNGGDAVRVGAHTKHLASAIAPAIGCAVCHVQPSDALSSAHVDGGPGEVTFSGTAVIDSSPVWTRSPGTCASTYCHAGPGASNATPNWTAAGTVACGACHGLPPPAPHAEVGPSLPGCTSCHDATLDAQGAIIPPSAGGRHLDGMVQSSGHPPAWMDRTSDGFHAREANRGLQPCTQCHGASLDGAGAPVATVSCATCHGGAGWSTSCVECHGGTNNPTGAPPRATWGNAADAVRTGAHSAHVQATAISPASDCALCHLKPASAFTSGHLDTSTAAEVVFAGRAIGQGTPTWDRGAATCASTRCHGGPGATNATPTWTRVGQGEAACGKCHGLPPPAPHPTASADLAGCRTCHQETMTSAGAVIAPSAGGKHLDGIVQAGGHPAAWMSTASEGFHANSANDGLDACKSCHGVNLDGVGGTAQGCQTCHGATWKTNCVLCHGGVDSATGAPPATVWGQASDVVRVGAHTAHLRASTARAPIACATCHTVPASALSVGHVDARETADVKFTGLAIRGVTAVWNRAGATCTTYCHGATLAGGSNTAPVWTGGPSAAACGTCHGVAPSTGQHGWHAEANAATCVDCHGPWPTALHVNGTTNVGGAITEWRPTYHTCVSACHAGYMYW